MTALASVQIAPVTKTEHGDAAKVVGMQGVSVIADGDDFLLTTIDKSGLALTAKLTEDQLQAFAHRLAYIIEEKNAVAILPDARMRIAGEPLVNSIILAVARRCGMGFRDIVGKGRETRLVRARFAAIWAARTASTCSFPKLGEIFGGRDHSSIVKAFRRANEWRETDSEFRQFTDALLAAITGEEDWDPLAPQGGDAA